MVRFEILTAVNVKITVFWNVSKCRVAEYQYKWRNNTEGHNFLGNIFMMEHVFFLCYVSMVQADHRQLSNFELYKFVGWLSLVLLYTIYIFFFSVTLRLNAGHGLLILECTRSHTQRRITFGRTPLEE